MQYISPDPYILCAEYQRLAQTALTWQGKVFAAADADAADAAETNWKHKVTPDWGDWIICFDIIAIFRPPCVSYLYFVLHFFCTRFVQAYLMFCNLYSDVTVLMSLWARMRYFPNKMFQNFQVPLPYPTIQNRNVHCEIWDRCIVVCVNALPW